MKFELQLVELICTPRLLLNFFFFVCLHLALSRSLCEVGLLESSHWWLPTEDSRLVGPPCSPLQTLSGTEDSSSVLGELRPHRLTPLGRIVLSATLIGPLRTGS